MTRDSHATASPNQVSQDCARPSLFAGFDQDGAEGIAPLSSRSLSALESQRQERKRPSLRSHGFHPPKPWLTRFFMVLMVAGMLVMLLSFVRLLRGPAPQITPPRPANTAETTSKPTNQAHQANQAAEIIETTPVAAQKTATPIATQPDDEAAAAKARPALAKVSSPPKKAATHETARRDAPPQRDDVALLEAMLTHTAPRKTPATGAQ